MKTDGIAINLFNVHTELEKDFSGTLGKLAEIGYPAVQLSGFPLRKHDPVRLRELLDSHGLKAAGCHAALYDLSADAKFYVDYMRIIGSEYIICPMAPAELVHEEQGYATLAGMLNEIGGEIKRNGMTFGYHNHAFEFTRFGGRSGLDIIMEDTDPELVTFEPDVYWIRKAGADIAGTILKYGRKCPLVHIKDMEAGPEGMFCEIGEGVIDFKEIFALRAAIGAVWFIVEQDSGRRPPMESAAISFGNLSKMNIAE